MIYEKNDEIELAVGPPIFKAKRVRVDGEHGYIEVRMRVNGEWHDGWAIDPDEFVRFAERVRDVLGA